MANSLENPPAPNPDNSSNVLQQSAPAQQAPAPTHAQTVAALRHFDAIKHQLMELMKLPTLGKADVKSNVIDGMTHLVSERIIPATQAVIQLSQLPNDPGQQRQWVQTMLAQAQRAEINIISHHAQGFAGQGPGQVPHRDNHMNDMAALHTQYGGG
jgi:hypothetical protein